MPSYLVLARKYRPSTFSDVIGQDHVIQTLCNSIVSGRVAHAFLFCGVRGVGKTTVARILAKALNCTGRVESDPNPCCQCSSCREITGGFSVDVQEIDGASNTSVENIREINENIKYPPAASRYKIIIIDEVHMISVNAFNALLKTLEEPPPHAKFMFATTELHKVPATINSRCQRHNFRTVSIRDMVRGMTGILDQEGLHASEEALALISREAQGSFRDALSLLDQVIPFSTGVITESDVTGILGIAGRDMFGKLVRGLLAGDASTALNLVHEVFSQGYDPEQFVLDLLRFLRNLIVVRTIPPEKRPEGLVDASPGELEDLNEIAGLTSTEELHNLLTVLMKSEGDVKRAGNPWIALEMAIMKLAYAPRIVDLAEILSKMRTTPVPIASPPVERRVSRRPAKAGPRAAEGPPALIVDADELPAPAPKARDSGADTTASIPAPAPSHAMPEDRTEIEPPPSVPPSRASVERFVIEDVRPAPQGTTDELWTQLKEHMEQADVGPSVTSLLEHGSLISFGPTVIEIGFNKAFYKQEFQSRFDEKEPIKQVFRDVFGHTGVKTLTLARETSLKTEKPYEPPKNGDTDKTRALKKEALDHPLVRAIQAEFEGCSIEDIKIL
ncbi:MAG: DNA polymerase III subunit gamma/tau [Pseudomonadota bacterium]